MKTLGAYLRDQRKNLNLSIQDVANKLGLAYSTVANMETGGKKPTLKQLKGYGLIFGCEWIDIISAATKIANHYMEGINAELEGIIKENGYQGSDYELTYNELSNAIKEVKEINPYLEEIEKEYEQEKAMQNLKISNDLDWAIHAIIERWTTKDSPAIDEKEISDLREMIKEIILIRAKQLTRN